MKTLSDLIFRVLEVSGGRPDLLSTRKNRRIQPISTSEFLGSIHSLALALDHRGVPKGTRIAILSENRPEWHVVDFACHLLGAVVVPIYPTLSDDQIAYILRNSGAEWVFYSNRQKGEQIANVRDSLSRNIEAVAMDDDAILDGGTSLVLLQAEGAPKRSAEPLERFRDRVEPADLASIIYTSGTTGDPKGVMLEHRAFIDNVLACSGLFELGPRDQALSFLPLSHVFERTVDYLFFSLGVAIHYAPSIERVPPLLLEVKPTVLSSVPRLYERAYLRVTANLSKESPRKQKIFRWAIRVGKRYAIASLDRFIGPWLALQRRVAKRLVYGKITERFGGRLRFAIAGGAPLGDEVAEFFEAVGIKLYQGYGLTETGPVLAVNRDGAARRGSVGPAVPGVELRIAEDGEILAKTPSLMRGYWENPEASAEVIDNEGWFHTGDIGEIDEQGFLFITDRKKDLLITSGGKNVPPQPIEQHLTSQPAISQAVVFGDRYPYLTALIVPQLEDLGDDVANLPPEELVDHPELIERIAAAVKRVNNRLAPHEQIRKFKLLPRELSIEAQEITPTLKVRRKIVSEKYADLISSMYLKTQRVSG